MIKYDKLSLFYHQLFEFRSMVLQTEETSIKKEIIYKNAVNLYNELLAIYFKDYSTGIYSSKFDVCYLVQKTHSYN